MVEKVVFCNKDGNGITKGKWYQRYTVLTGKLEIAYKDDIYYHIENDNGSFVLYKKSNFLDINEYRDMIINSLIH